MTIPQSTQAPLVDGPQTLSIPPDPDAFNRHLLSALIAVRDGNFGVRLPGDLTGLTGKLADVFNEMAALGDMRAREVTRVCRMVGREGRLRERMFVPGVAGARAEEVRAINGLIDDLIWPTTEVTRAVGAVARGDLGQAMSLEVDGRPLEGEFLRAARLVNSMIDQLSVFAAEVTRVAREVGTEGKLGGQAEVRGVSGVWKDLTDSVNQMAGNLTAQVRNIADVTIAVANGDLSKKITVDVRGEILQLKEAINTMVDQLRSFAAEVTRVAREVGTDGKLGGQAIVPGVAGTWKDLTDSVNAMASNLTSQVRNIAEVTTAVARGDLSRKITVDVKGEILELKNTINTMVDQLNAFASEVSRVAREVGTEGKLGGQADAGGIAGTWKDLTDNVNSMATNLTAQVRNIAEVTTAVARGDLSRKITVDVKGEILELKDTINTMVDQLNAFASEVTRVAHEVGTEGRLGGQAAVPGVAGTWKNLTDNVNSMASNLTGQVRSIATVATAIAQGDLTRSIQVEARGEVADLKDNINRMIDTLRATIERNHEQDWLKTNLAKFARMLQGQRDLVTVGRMLLSELVPLVGAQQGTVYQMEAVPTPSLWLLASYAQSGHQPERISVGEGLVGQCALEKQRILLHQVPRQYTRIRSSLGESSPATVVVLPVLFEGDTKAVIELASLQPFTATHLAFLEQLTQSIGVVFNTIKATMRTENLLQQSQQLTTELTTRQAELQQTNEELASKAKQLAEQNAEVERKNREVEQARKALEEKAAELALTSKYKSEFLANMSHELRTPLNSILILGQQLTENQHGNLSAKQVEWARNIHSAGADLLGVINDILDLSKIESGTVTVEVEELPFATLGESLTRTFRPVAESKHLEFRVELDPALPRAFLTDSKRLQQILKNLLANAFKFTAQGHVSLTVRPASEGWSPDHPVFRSAPQAIAFTVSDTGIGIEPDKQKLIFEAFQQADAGTSRKYGGTGLGLAISRELATLLGGEIRLTSVPDEGSRFTLYLPLAFAGSSRAPATPTIGVQTPLVWPTPALVTNDETIADDRDHVNPEDRVLLIVDDDAHYSRVLLGLARDRGFKGIVASRGETALSLARQFPPTAVTLDVLLPDMLGWSVLNHLKQNPETRHIPVQMLSVEEERQHGLARGAFSYLVKPATTVDLERAIDRLTQYVQSGPRRLLIVEDDDIERAAIVDLLAHDDVEITAVGTGGEALQALETAGAFECCVVDLRLPDVTGFDLLEYLKTVPRFAEMPLVVYTGKQLTTSEQDYLRRVAKSVILKDVQSPDRLFDETALFLHRVVARLPEPRQRLLERLYRSSEILNDRRVLVVDDDARNIFALTTVLENQGMTVLSATNGRDAIDIVRNTTDLRAVLMDIMMPDMDGYETMRAIRREPAFRMLPILALTAKAMKGDREKCLEAGASDYIAKPVNTEQLLSLLRAWLHR